MNDVRLDELHATALRFHARIDELLAKPKCTPEDLAEMASILEQVKEITQLLGVLRPIVAAEKQREVHDATKEN